MSSSSSFNVIRRHSSSAADIRLKELTQELAKQRSELAGAQMETDDVRSMGRMDHSTIKLNDERLKFITTLQGANTDFFYEFPTEPDFNFLKVWFMLDHLGARMRDMSGLGNDAFIVGHPTLRRSGLDMGFQQTASGGGMSATPVMLFNSGTDVVSQKNGEYVWIPDNSSVKFTLFPVGFSITFRFNCLDFNNHTNADNVTNVRRFAAKTDDALNGWNLVVYPTNAGGTTGGVEMNIVHNGVTYQRRTTGYNINTYYQVVVTYDPNVTANLRIKIYTGGIENTIAGFTNLFLPTQTNLRIGARDSENGFFYGYLQDFRLYMGKVLTQAEITNINSNEISIDNITKGRIFVVQYALISGAMRSKTHKFNIGGRVIRSKIHKFNVTKKLVLTHTHRFVMVKGVSRTRTHKFSMAGFVSRTRTHKFSLGGHIVKTKTHKYNITQTIARTRTHKFNMGGTVAQYIRFLKSTTAGSNIIQDVALTNTPQCVIIWSDGTTSDNTFNNGYQFYYGYSDGTNNACVSSLHADNVTTTDAFSGHKTDKAIAMMNATIGTVASEAAVTFTTNNARFTWSTNDNRAVYIHMLAISGVAAAEVKSFTTGQTTTGTRTYSLNNSSIIPNFVQTINNGSTANWATTMADAISIGSAAGTTKQWSIANNGEDAQSIAADFFARSYYDSSNVLVGIDDDTGSIEMVATLSSFGTGNFVLNWTDAPISSTAIFSALCIQGGNIDVGGFAEPGATGTQVTNVASTVNTAVGLMIYNTNTTASGLNTSGSFFSVGGASGTGASAQGVVTVGDPDATSATQPVRINKTGSIVKTILPTAIATSSTTSSEASVSALGVDSFTLNWSARDSTRRNHFVIFGTG